MTPGLVFYHGKKIKKGNMQNRFVYFMSIETMCCFHYCIILFYLHNLNYNHEKIKKNKTHCFKRRKRSMFHSQQLLFKESSSQDLYSKII